MEKYSKIIFLGFLFSCFSTLIIGSGSRRVPRQQQYMPVYYNNTDQNDRYYDKDGKFKPVTTIAGESLLIGVGNGIDRTTQDTISDGFSFIPSFLKRVGILTTVFIYKLAYGSRGLNSEVLGYDFEAINKVVDPYTKKTYGSNDRVKRMTEIDQAMNNDVKDKNWEKIQEKIIRIISNLESTLTKSLPCYNPKYSNVGIARRSLANLVYLFSTQDNEQISRGILSTLRDLKELKEYVSDFKSQKEVEQNTDNIKTWLNIVLLDIRQLMSLVNGDEMNKVSFSTPARPTLQGSSGLSELLAGVGG